MKVKIPVIVISFIVTLYTNSFSQPIVVNGALLREVCSTPIASLRLCTSDRHPVPFQIDELTENGNYICDKGNTPNSDSSNGVFDPRDEIVFLFEDCDTSESLKGLINPGVFYHRLTIGGGTEKRFVFITNDTSVPLSSMRYIEYDHKSQFVKTPYFLPNSAQTGFTLQVQVSGTEKKRITSL